jgi:hypothetical protein
MGCKMKILYFTFLFLSSVCLFSLPNEYNSQFIKSYLVNYYAIKSDYFLTKLAYKRFSFLDEASDKERRFIRQFDKDYLILYYKDIVALHTSYSEFNDVNLQEWAFLHTSEPACLTVSFNKQWKFNWMKDRRFHPDSVKYRLYWGFDSTEVNNPTDTIVAGTELSISLPKSARWVRLKTVLSDSAEIDYSFPVKLFFDESIPLYVPAVLELDNSSPGFSIVSYIFLLISKVQPDSVWLFVDVNNNNQFSEGEKYVYNSNLNKIQFEVFFDNAGSKGGVEAYMVCFKDGKQYRYPQSGYWTTNVNNRSMNQTYGFYVMNVANPLWRRSYIEQVLKALTKDYNGLFADDTWSWVGSWGVDAYPPFDYNDSVWYEGVNTFLKEIKEAIGGKPLIFNGLSDGKSLRFLEVADGGMTEGFAHSTWGGFASLNSWKLECNLGLQCQKDYRKWWVPLGGIKKRIAGPRIYSLASFLLVADTNSYFGNAENYQIFAHFPEFDIPTGKPLTSAVSSIDDLAKVDGYGKSYYMREFEKCWVYVNPNPTDRVILPEIEGKYQVQVDTFLTVNGGKLFSVKSDSILPPRSAKIVLKGNVGEPKLMSPVWKNPVAKIKAKSRDELTFEFSVEAADSSSDFFKSNPNLPLYVAVDLTNLGVVQDLDLENDGTPASPEFSMYSGSIDLPAGVNLGNITIPFVVFSTTGLFSVGYAPLVIENIDTTNLVPNFSFEYDLDFDGLPDRWNKYNPSSKMDWFVYDSTPGNAQHLKKCVKFTNESNTDACGLYTKIVFPKDFTFPVKVSGWSKAENVSGNPDNDYSIYVDFFFTDGEPWYGKTAKFSTGTHDWEYSEAVYYPPKPLASANVYCLFRKHSGTVWFDNIFVGYADTSLSVDDKDFVDEQKMIIPEILCESCSNEALIVIQNPSTATISAVDIYGNICLDIKLELSAGTNRISLGKLFQSLPSGVYGIQFNIGSKRIAKTILILK